MVVHLRLVMVQVALAEQRSKVGVREAQVKAHLCWVWCS